jgi:hypothetical protein
VKYDIAAAKARLDNLVELDSNRGALLLYADHQIAADLRLAMAEIERLLSMEARILALANKWADSYAGGYAQDMLAALDGIDAL